jgi:hypothetical protein
VCSYNKHLSDEYKIIEKMKNWIWDNYKDPADGVPYSSQEGGYQYFNGGPYYSYEVLFDKYHDLYDDKLIKKAASKLNITVLTGLRWEIINLIKRNFNYV